MEFASKKAGVFVPDGLPFEAALSRTTHMGIGAHQDDLEIMAFHGILECHRAGNRGFLGVVVSDGAGSPRQGAYASTTDAQMQEIRNKEQQNAASVGGYSASVILRYPTSILKDPQNTDPVIDIKALISSARPAIVYTHNLADKHDTHVAVALRTIGAIRELPQEYRPKTLYGCEVWRGLDWMDDADKVALDVTGEDGLASKLIQVHESQVAGGKRYDIATLGRRSANATYFAAHDTDKADMLIFAMDLTPLITNDSVDPAEFTLAHIEKLSRDVAGRLKRLS